MVPSSVDIWQIVHKEMLNKVGDISFNDWLHTWNPHLSLSLLARVSITL